MLNLKFPKTRFRLGNHTRFIAFVLVFLLAVTAIIIAVTRNKPEEPIEAAIVVTPTATFSPTSTPTPTPVPTPVPTPTPYPIPEGKVMDEVVIVLDPGHGGRDPGTISPYQKDFYEKDVTLDIAKRVQAILAENGIKVIMTREGDERIVDSQKEDLKARAEVANNNNAAFFVSIHVNAYDMSYKGAASVNGMEVYYLNKPAMYENFTPKQLANLMAEKIQASSGIKLNYVQSNDYSVLRNTLMPAILIETAYITNKEDFERLKSDEFRDLTAAGIADGIMAALQEVGAFEYNNELYVFKEAESE